MTTAQSTRLAVVAEQRTVHIAQVAYSIDELSAVTGESRDALYRRIRNGTLAARHTGRRYVVTGPAALAAGLRGARNLVNYRDVIDPDVRYTLKELGVFLTLSYYAARRLVQNSRIATASLPGARIQFRGADILAYLDGRDDPMQHPESA